LNHTATRWQIIKAYKHQLTEKRRKEAVERKRNKKQYINAENEIKDRKTVARHKGYLILKEKKEAKCPRTNNYVTHQ
jgi:ribosomal 30S subunit maturation factor RimM